MSFDSKLKYFHSPSLEKPTSSKENAINKNNIYRKLLWLFAIIIVEINRVMLGSEEIKNIRFIHFYLELEKLYTL